MIRRLALGLTAAALSGCVTTPVPPRTAMPTGGEGRFASLPTASIAPVPDDWWRLYDDATLDRLVAQSLAANADLKVAFGNLATARAALRLAKAQRLPQTTIESGLTVDKTASQPSASSNVATTDYDLAATASWDIDLFGRLRSGALAAQADADATSAALDGVRVAIVADTVLAYVDLCGATQGGRLSREIAAAQERSVALIREQLRAGEVSPLEVSQAAGLLEAAQATLPAFEAQRANALYRLATLQGAAPAVARSWSIACDAPPRLAAPLPVGDGSGLLLRRPDVREAERRLAAASARIGVARADLYPRLTLGGAVGLLTGGLVATASPLLSWNFPNQGPARARLAQARGTEASALAAWDVTVLRALREVETALAAVDAEARRNASLENAVREADLYKRRASAKVRLGDAAYLLQVDAERTRAAAALQRAQSDLLLAQAQVATFRALGGGWRGAAETGEAIRNAAVR